MRSTSTAFQMQIHATGPDVPNQPVETPVEQPPPATPTEVPPLSPDSFPSTTPESIPQPDPSPRPNNPASPNAGWYPYVCLRLINAGK